MKHRLQVALNGTPEQFQQLRELQVAFAEVCNAIAPVVQSTRCWNRVALHHLVYRSMRERFPALGSQMICNAVYSVSRTARLILQHPKSPWNINKQSGGPVPLPLLRFAPTTPVYFDRHTLSLKDNVLSMFTLDGRIRFSLSLTPSGEERFHREKLLEVVLVATPKGFDLIFQFTGQNDAAEIQQLSSSRLLPEYVVVIPADTTQEPSPANKPLPQESSSPVSPG